MRLEFGFSVQGSGFGVGGLGFEFGFRIRDWIPSRAWTPKKAPMPTSGVGHAEGLTKLTCLSDIGRGSNSISRKKNDLMMNLLSGFGFRIEKVPLLLFRHNSQV